MMTLLSSILRAFELLAFSLLATLVTIGGTAWAGSASQYRVHLPEDVSLDLTEPFAKGEMVGDPYQFHGLARYLNHIRYYVIEGERIQRIEPRRALKLSSSQTFAAVGRFNALVLKGRNVNLDFSDANHLSFNFEGGSPGEVKSWLVPKSDLYKVSPELNLLRYAQLPMPLRWLARGVEWLMVSIQAALHLNWGLSLVIFALILKLLLLPVTRTTKRLQNTVSKHQEEMKPEIAQIKRTYSGEEAHNRMMQLYKERGISPFFTLKPSLGLFIQVPLLIAIFNVLGEMHQFSGVSFLWVDDLAKPDALAQLGFSIPYFGNSFNALPVLMVLVAAYTALRYSDPYAGRTAIVSKRFQLLAMGVIFLLLFYPFPAAMTLYWLLTNLFYFLK